MELFGGAGHSKEIAKRISSNGMLIGIDRDQEALKAAQNNLKEFHNIKYVHDNHDNIKNIYFGSGFVMFANKEFVNKEKDKAKNKPKAFPLCSRERFFVLGKYSRIKIE